MSIFLRIIVVIVSAALGKGIVLAFALDHKVAAMIREAMSPEWREAIGWLIVGGIGLAGLGAWEFVTRALPSNRAKLIIREPYTYKDHPLRTHWCIPVHNAGPAPAKNVQMRLLSLVPRPREPMWSDGLPFLVRRDGHTIDEPAPTINKDTDERFELIHTWQNPDREIYFTGLITTGSAQAVPMRLQNDERWTLAYEVTAENADRITFAIEMFGGNQGATLRRRTT
jgi:hypothetical protein